jgi:hypothetical protein
LYRCSGVGCSEGAADTDTEKSCWQLTATRIWPTTMASVPSRHCLPRRGAVEGGVVRELLAADCEKEEDDLFITSLTTVC